MANRERGELRLVTSAQTFTLRLTVGTCCELEDRTGQDFDAIQTRVARGRITELRLLLWAALQPYHATIYSDVASVDALIDLYGVKETRALMRALLLLNVNDDPPKDEDGKAVKDERPGSIWRRLYLDLRCFGLPRNEYWDLSLLELWREMAAVRQKSEEIRKQVLTQAWWNAQLVWSKKLPELSTLIDVPKKRAEKEAWQGQGIKAALRRFPQAQPGNIAAKGAA